MKSVLVCFVGLLTVTAHAQSPPLEVLFHFPSSLQNPYAPLVQAPDGQLYGTVTGNRGPAAPGNGGVFKVTTNGTLTSLAVFTPITGAGGTGLALGTDGNLYGAAEKAAFRMSTNGTITPLVQFVWADGIGPRAGLTAATDGTFYGTTAQGGSNGVGTVFRITTNGTLTTLIHFNSTNGAEPRGVLLLGSDGAFYGSTSRGGSSDQGTIFKITTGGALTTLVQFNSTNGANPQAGLAIGADGNFYGTTAQGGSGGVGTVFRMTPTGVLTTLINFTFANANGASPSGSLALRSDGSFYGTTAQGGANSYGTVIRVTTNGVLTILRAFNYADGANPNAGLFLANDGNFYGTTPNGGAAGNGTIFRVAASGAVSTIASFPVARGWGPQGTVIFGRDGNLYGTTQYGGSGGLGTVFRLNPSRTLTTLVNFSAATGGDLRTSLALGPEGHLYGTTHREGNNFVGTVFRVTTNGALTTLVHCASANGAYPWGTLTLGADGFFYGTTSQGGNWGRGTVFRMTTNGTYTLLASFDGTNGIGPQAGVVFGNDGNLYGTTWEGGPRMIGGGGTVFQVTPGGTLRSFPTVPGMSNGYSMNALTLGPDGRFYGTTTSGSTVFTMTTDGTFNTLLRFTNSEIQGASLVWGADGYLYGSTYAIAGYGSVFKMTPNGTLTRLADFTFDNGSAPEAELTPGPDGSFYGTTSRGGSGDAGVIFRLNLPPHILTQPVSRTNAVGTTATFTIGVTGTRSFGYQWQRNGTNLVDAGNSSGTGTDTLTLTNVQASDSGNYTVISSNNWGSVTSIVAVLAVHPRPVASLQFGIPGPYTNTLTFTGAPNATYRVEFATNLTTSAWFTLSTNTASPDGTWTAIDGTATNAQRFYRVATP